MRRCLAIFLIIFGFCVSSARAETDLSKEPVTSSRCNIFTFDSTGSYDPDNENITFLWEFGDGSSSTEPVVDHVYQASGDYPVSLKISDNSSATCCTSILSQVVRANIPPDPTFTGPDKACTDSPLTFNNTAEEGNVTSFGYNYDWDFGDGSRATGGGAVKKTYTTGGDYKVTLAVDDQRGSGCSVRSFTRGIHVNQPPVAEAGDDVMEQCMTGPDDAVTLSFNATKSTDANSDPLSFFWDFGDGDKAQGIQVSHLYRTPGNYEVKLVVNDQSELNCNTAVDFVQVRLGVAPKAEAGEPVAACPNEEITFDGSGSYTYTPGTLGAEWNFGDGQAEEGIKAKHSYFKPGRYSAVLSVKNLTNQACPIAKDTKPILINTPPVVTLSASKSACIGQTVEFIANAQDPDGDPMEFYWTFGDGEILRAGPKVTHEYRQGGRYRVSVIVDDGQKTACSTGTAELMFKVNTPPQAYISAPTVINVGKPIEFNASASSDPDGDNLTYQWDFGDGTRGDGVVAAHTYEERGSYQVKLLVNDASGSACSENQTSVVADVRSAPVAVMTIR